MSRLSRTRSWTSRKSSRLTASEDNRPPWPEWTDIYVNSTLWNPYEVAVPIKTQTAKGAKTAVSSKTAVGNKRMSTAKQSIVESVCEKYFLDGWSYLSDFKGIDVAKWERAAKIEGLLPILVQDYFSSSLDLISSNMHLLNNKLMKDIVESVSCLFMASISYPFTAEFQGTNFTPSQQFWKPWHHVYANNKAGTGDVPTPSYNKFGKYLVRLYFMGKWRRIEVDDFFPLGTDGKLLLPVTCDKDIWFPILAKALVQVITACGDENNITVITALTGWIKTSVKLDETDSTEVWNLCCSHLIKQNELLPQISEDIHCSYFGNSCLNDIRHLSESRTQKVLLFADIIEAVYSLEDIEPKKRELFTFINKVAQNWIKPKDYPLWKEHRWMDWAYRHNILRGKIGQIFKTVEVYCPVWNALSECSPVPSQSSINPSDPPNYFKDCEFDKFKNNVVRFYLYYLPSQFEHNFRSDDLEMPYSVTTEKTTGEQNRKSKSATKGQDQVKNKSQVLFPQASRYHESSCPSFYLLIDSPYCKRLYMDMLFFKTESDCSSGHVTCEKFLWQEDVQPTPIFFSKTEGSLCDVIVAGPGRHTFKICCVLPQKYFIQFFSNTPFLLDSLENLQEIFLDDSVSFKIYGTNITEQFKLLSSSQYGSERHGQALKNYTEAFYPTNLRQKNEAHQNIAYRIQFDKLLEECLLEFIENNDIVKSLENTSNFIEKMRKFMLNPSFGEKFLSRLRINNNLEGAQAVDSPITNGKSTAKGKDKIKVPPISDDIFFDKVENNIIVLKKLMAKEKSFLQYYPFCYDEDTKLTFHDYKGKTEMQFNHPFFVAARMIFNIHSSMETPCAIYLSISHDFSRLCVFDIETMNPVHLGFDRSSVWRLTRSNRGFIILALCFNQTPQIQSKAKPQDLQWKIRVAASTENNLPHPCRLDQGIPCLFTPATLPFPVSETIRGYYVPNAFNVITRFMITINQNDIVTLQLSVSCLTAVLSLVIKNKNQEIVKMIEGKGNILMPAVVLPLSEANDKNGQLYYLGEVLLKYDSWKLTQNEKIFMNTAKEVYVPFSDISASPTKGKKRKSKFSLDDDAFAPSWTLTMMTEQTARDKTTKLLPDTLIYDDFKRSNAESFTEERLAKGTELRVTFWSYLEDEINQGEYDKEKLDVQEYYHDLIYKYSCDKYS